MHVYPIIREGVRLGSTNAGIATANPRLGMDATQVGWVRKKILRRGGVAQPGRHGVGRGGEKIGEEQVAYLLGWLETTGARKTAACLKEALFMRFGLEVAESGVLAALKRYGISRKKLTKMDKRAFSAEIRELTTTFLFRRLGLDKRHGVWVGEMHYKAEDVGNPNGYASASLRAIQVDDGRGSGDGVMFVAAINYTKVLPISLPVMQPATVTAWVFGTWCENFLIPQMLRGKSFVCMDNAGVHRHGVLRALFFLAGLEIIFTPPYSPWFMPIEKIFLSTHMKCNRQVAHIRVNFIPNVLEVLHSHTPGECSGVVMQTGWIQLKDLDFGCNTRGG